MRSSHPGAKHLCSSGASCCMMWSSPSQMENTHLARHNCGAFLLPDGACRSGLPMTFVTINNTKVTDALTLTSLRNEQRHQKQTANRKPHKSAKLQGKESHPHVNHHELGLSCNSFSLENKLHSSGCGRQIKASSCYSRSYALLDETLHRCFSCFNNPYWLASSDPALVPLGRTTIFAS